MRGIVKIRRMEAELGWPELPSAIAVAALAARQSIRADIGSKQFSHFIRTTKARDGQQWAVATISAERMAKLELPKPERPRVLRLDSQFVDKSDHRKKFGKLVADGKWDVIQSTLDAGFFMPSRRWHLGGVFKDERGKLWLTILAYNQSGEVFLDTIFRTKQGYVDSQIQRWVEYADNG